MNTVGKNQNTAEPRRTPHVTSKYHALRECESVVVVAGEIFRPLPPPPPAHEFYTFNMSATANPAETVPPLPAPAPPVPAAKKKKKKKRKKRKKPPPSLAAPVMKSRRVARGVTTNFHRITHEIDRVRSDASIDEDTRAQRLDTLTGDLQALGGRTAYQDASIVNTSMFRTSRYVTQVLTRQGVRPKSGSVLPRILEVGAINTQLVNTPWLNTDALDLNSRHPKIQQIDFFEFPCVPGEYDVVVSSMVINCMPTAHQRGALLTKCRRHLRPKGFFFPNVATIMSQELSVRPRRRPVSVGCGRCRLQAGRAKDDAQSRPVLFPEDGGAAFGRGPTLLSRSAAEGEEARWEEREAAVFRFRCEYHRGGYCSSRALGTGTGVAVGAVATWQVLASTKSKKYINEGILQYCT